MADSLLVYAGYKWEKIKVAFHLFCTYSKEYVEHFLSFINKRSKVLCGCVRNCKNTIACNMGNPAWSKLRTKTQKRSQFNCLPYVSWVPKLYESAVLNYWSTSLNSHSSKQNGCIIVWIGKVTPKKLETQKDLYIMRTYTIQYNRNTIEFKCDFTSTWNTGLYF